MNKERKGQLKDVISALNELKDDLEEIRNAEQMYFDDMPENLQTSEKGEISSNAIDIMNTTLEGVEAVISDISSLL